MHAMRLCTGIFDCRYRCNGAQRGKENTLMKMSFILVNQEGPNDSFEGCYGSFTAAKNKAKELTVKYGGSTERFLIYQLVPGDPIIMADNICYCYKNGSWTRLNNA
jgi:hypothetical protein